MTAPDLFDAAWQRRHAALIRARRNAQRGYRRQAERAVSASMHDKLRQECGMRRGKRG